MTIEEKVIQAIGDTTGELEKNIHLSSRLVDDLEFDDLDFIELVIYLEEDFGIEIIDEDIEKCGTVQDVVNYLRNTHGCKDE